MNSNQAIRLPFYIGAAIALGIFIGAQMAGDSKSQRGDLFKSLNKLRQVITYIENDYVDEVDTEDLVEGVIDEMLGKLDPHTVYIPSRDIELAQSQLQGNFEGIGIEFNIFKDTVYVVAPLSGGPSEKLGLQPGDKIIKVDGENIAGVGFTNRDVINLLRGPKGSEVNVTILRSSGDNMMIEYTIERDVIPQYSVDVSYMIDEETGYIKVSRFAATTFMEFKEAMYNLEKSGMKRLIVDLTGNPGGYLNTAVDMVDEFLGGNQLIVYTQGKESRYNENYISKRDGDFEEGALIVLIDEGSASASEIVSGALQDHDRALIVGRRSFGKGLVQMPISLNDGSELRLTISRYYTPSGRSIQKPFNGSVADYNREYIARFETGEVFSEDSVQINDSLVYQTDKGRLVYGGGGIVPDYFVPFDTLGNSAYFNRLFTSNTVAEYALNYSEENHDMLEQMSKDSFIKDFEVSDGMLDDIIKMAEGNGVPFVEVDFLKSQSKIELYVKAFIGRRIWDNEGFYPIIHQDNEILQRAIELFDEAEKMVSAD
jgi:carboxyl-terminal processing protease